MVEIERSTCKPRGKRKISQHRKKSKKQEKPRKCADILRAGAHATLKIERST
jgi:hypothetical protein